MLGRLAQQGRVEVPVVTLVTDAAVHPYWLHPGVSGHLAVLPSAAEALAVACPGTPVRCCGPLVAARFHTPPAAAAARAAAGLAPDTAVVLLVAGAWGSGDVAGTARAVQAAAPGAQLVVACGRNERLRRRLEAAGVRAVGWVDDMAGLLAAADAVVENAGGLTSLEAFAARVPVVTFRPLPGHGRANAETLGNARLTIYARDDVQLAAALDRCAHEGAERDAQVERAAAVFVPDPLAEVLALCDEVRPCRARRGGRGRRTGRG